ncbi:hypothetical protein TEA_026363 [Camellia sinensis var. sinensis]|uniref:peroxidase n=1 Tax=Camellia sinensis var. sinensis TaxID=542762 RepID=A0A4S4F358_CAMSN|nr:hypothetical protein TEA_026363 [Camellia sinensis var. sinensis]
MEATAMKNTNSASSRLKKLRNEREREEEMNSMGCDGSVLLNSTSNNQAEKDGPANISLHAFYVIDNAKKEVEAKCPGVVSCADILALAARDAVALSGGPTWNVQKGRKDGRISKAIDTRLLPAPTFNISQLQQSFAQRGLSFADLVALSGGHTLGFSHCSSFQNRIHNFDTKNDVDPSLQPSFAANLRSVCPLHNTRKNAGATMDTTSTIFDNVYFKLLLQGKSLFTSDEALLSAHETKTLVSKFANSQEDFNRAFVNSMLKMGSLNGGQEDYQLANFIVHFSEVVLFISVQFCGAKVKVNCIPNPLILKEAKTNPEGNELVAIEPVALKLRSVNDWFHELKTFPSGSSRIPFLNSRSDRTLSEEKEEEEETGMGEQEWKVGRGGDGKEEGNVGSCGDGGEVLPQNDVVLGRYMEGLQTRATEDPDST